MNFYTISAAIWYGAVKSHIGFYTFTIEWIFYVIIHHQTRNSMTELELEKLYIFFANYVMKY